MVGLAGRRGGLAGRCSSAGGGAQPGAGLSLERFAVDGHGGVSRLPDAGPAVHRHRHWTGCGARGARGRANGPVDGWADAVRSGGRDLRAAGDRGHLRGRFTAGCRMDDRNSPHRAVCRRHRAPGDVACPRGEPGEYRCRTCSPDCPGRAHAGHRGRAGGASGEQPGTPLDPGGWPGRGDPVGGGRPHPGGVPPARADGGPSPPGHHRRPHGPAQPSGPASAGRGAAGGPPALNIRRC